MKRKVAIAIMLLSVSLTGCQYNQGLTINEDGKTATTDLKVVWQREELEALGLGGDALEDYTVEVIDGKEYYVETQDPKIVDLKELNTYGTVVTPDIFFMSLGKDNSLMQDDVSDSEDAIKLSEDTEFNLNVSLSADILLTNANESEAKNARFKLLQATDDFIFAYTANGNEQINADKTLPVIKGAKNNAWVKNLRSIKFDDNIGIRDINLNNKLTSSSTVEENGKVYTNWKDTDSKELTKQGKNTFIVRDIAGNTATFTVNVDSKVPTVSGVKNGKTYKKPVIIKYSDKGSGIKTATLNGKSFKSGKKVSKKGSYTVVLKDKVGNKTTIKFKIKAK